MTCRVVLLSIVAGFVAVGMLHKYALIHAIQGYKLVLKPPKYRQTWGFIGCHGIVPHFEELVLLHMYTIIYIRGIITLAKKKLALLLYFYGCQGVVSLDAAVVHRNSSLEALSCLIWVVMSHQIQYPAALGWKMPHTHPYITDFLLAQKFSLVLGHTLMLSKDSP